jgi:hypothetical protein
VQEGISNLQLRISDLAGMHWVLNPKFDIRNPKIAGGRLLTADSGFRDAEAHGH